jgi:hypothetical protein
MAMAATPLCSCSCGRTYRATYDWQIVCPDCFSGMKWAAEVEVGEVGDGGEAARKVIRAKLSAVTRVCARPECGKAYTPTTPPQKFCSIACRDEAYAVPTEHMPLAGRVCGRPGCGKTFTASSGSQKFCSIACRDGAYRASYQRPAPANRSRAKKPAAAPAAPPAAPAMPAASPPALPAPPVPPAPVEPAWLGDLRAELRAELRAFIEEVATEAATRAAAAAAIPAAEAAAEARVEQLIESAMRALFGRAA